MSADRDSSPADRNSSRQLAACRAVPLRAARVFLCESFDYLLPKATKADDLKMLQTRTFYGKEKKSLDQAAVTRQQGWNL